jgi:hypothetical protein
MSLDWLALLGQLLRGNHGPRHMQHWQQLAQQSMLSEDGAPGMVESTAETLESADQSIIVCNLGLGQ